MLYIFTFLALVINITWSYADSIKNKNNPYGSTTGVIDKFYVGADNACDFSTIQAGISAANNSQNSPEVRVASNKFYNENIFISNTNILIDGNYANCTDARNDIHGGNRAKVNGFPGSTIATVQVTTGLFVHLKGIQLQNNNGGGVYTAGTSVITLEDMLFFQLGTHALRITGNGQVDVRIKNTLFLQNSSDSNGAAINCSGSNHSIDMTEGSGFANSTKSGLGGAMYLSGGCDLSMTDGVFQNNNATFGGAIFIINSNMALKNVLFNSNAASSEGGAILAFNAIIDAEATRFTNNQAENYGGAISIEPGAVFNLKEPSQGCGNSDKCNLFDGNKAQNGGAISLRSSSADISSTYFENNRADNGTAIYLYSSSSVQAEGNLYNNNGNHAANGFEDRNVIYATDNSEMAISYSTFADNNALFSTFKQENDADLMVLSSIIYDSDSGDVFASTGSSTTLNTHCLIVHESGSFDTTNAVITVADPIFVDAANGDYHLTAGVSPAIDYCTDTLAMAQNKDLDFQNRGIDDPNISNNLGNGTYDIGADESYGNAIFMNGFE